MNTTMANTPNSLAPWESQIVQCVAQGHSLAQSAAALGVPQETAKSYLHVVKNKLGVHSAPALVHAAYEAHMIPEPLPDDRPAALSAEQLQLLPLIAQGLKTQQMATQLRKPLGDVRRDTRNLLLALGATNPAHAMTRARQLGLLGPATRRKRELGDIHRG